MTLTTRLKLSFLVSGLTSLILLSGCTFNSAITNNDTNSGSENSREIIDLKEENSERTVINEDKKEPKNQTVQTPEVEENTPVADKIIETDLWQYIANHQNLTQIQHPRIEQFQKYFLKHSYQLKRKTDRAAPYLYYIIQELEKRQMPLELAFTPMVESNFDPLAHSVVQAAGLWQFMPRTAKGFGLKINQWYDGRRDIVASTEAALDYYQYLNKMFKGDWLLTVAAYNVGEGKVRKAIRNNKKSGKATDYWSLKLPKETMRHVPKWIALSNLLINHQNFDLKLADIKNQPQFASVEIQAPANLAQLAKITGIDKNEFYRLNPAFNKLFVPQEHQSAEILVPIKSLENFEQKIASMPAEIFKISMNYQVKAGDNLSYIAKKYHTRVAEIKKLNGLKSDRLQIGQILKLPGFVEITAEEQAFFSKLSKYQKRRRYQIYKVRAGDSLWKIARKFKVSTHKLAKWNGLSTKKILRIGQPLKVWPRH